MKQSSYPQTLKNILVISVIVFTILSCQKEEMAVSSSARQTLSSSVSEKAINKKATRAYKDDLHGTP